MRFHRHFQTAPITEALRKAAQRAERMSNAMNEQGNSQPADHTPSSFQHAAAAESQSLHSPADPVRHCQSHPSILSDDQRSELKSSTVIAPKPETKRVLVIDDEATIADTLAAILSTAGYESAVAYDGRAALEKCDSFPPDLVVTDVVMPGMSGVEAAIEIKRRFPDCKILLFSGQAATSDLLEEARRSGHDFELLCKPVHPTDLLRSLAA